MSFFKKIFNKTEAPRQLSQVQDLLKGDIIVLSDSFALPENLRQQEFQVTAVNTYEFEHENQLEWVLKGRNNQSLSLSLDCDDKAYLKFALQISHDDVACLFDLDEFSVIFDECKALLTKKADNASTSGWTSERYQQYEHKPEEFAQMGYFHRKDHRSEEISAFEGKEAGEPFELYTLFDEAQSKGIDLEVWQDGDTDVFLTLYRPTTDIIDMYPGS